MARILPEITSVDPLLQKVIEKVRHGQRLMTEEGMAILHTPDLIALGRLADEVTRARSGETVYFSVNKHVNYSNICELNCAFCRFSRRRDDDGAFELSDEDILRQIPSAVREVHLVGGLHPDWPFDRYRDMVRSIRRHRPEAHIKGFTAVEIDHFARRAGRSVEEILRMLREDGLTSLPGGGAEIFSPRVRHALCPNKPSGKVWLDVHRTAHRLGIPSNATMLYGHIETPEERLSHLTAIRELQDQTHGFLCFVPLPFQPDGVLEIAPSHPCEDLRLIALSRLYLDNIPHIKAYWVMLGLETTMMSLAFGADDIDGTVMGERIAHAAGATTPGGIDRTVISCMVEQTGKTARERDSLYNLVNHD